MNICTEFDGPRSILLVVIIWTRFGPYIIKLKATSWTLADLLWIYLKIDKDHLHSKMNVCTEFTETMSTLCLVTMSTRFGLYIIKLKATVHRDLDLWWINLKRDHLHFRSNVCAKFDKPRSILCLLIIRTGFGLYVNIVMVTVTQKSIGIIYTLRRMSVPCLTNLGQYCV